MWSGFLFRAEERLQLHLSKVFHLLPVLHPCAVLFLINLSLSNLPLGLRRGDSVFHIACAPLVQVRVRACS